MKSCVRLLLIGGVTTGLLSGCVGLGTDLGRAEKTRPAGPEFQQSLYKEYLDYAKSEYAQGDYIDSDRSSRKAIATAQGQPPQPEQIAGRNLPAFWNAL